MSHSQNNSVQFTFRVEMFVIPVTVSTAIRTNRISSITDVSVGKGCFIKQRQSQG